MTNTIDKTQDHKGQVISEYATLTTKALTSHGELLTTAMDNYIENRETVLRLIERLVMNGTLSNKDDVEYILNRKLEREDKQWAYNYFTELYLLP